MKPVTTYIVSASLPERIIVLKELAYNFWWSWNYNAQELFERIDPDLWEEVNHNPVILLNKISSERMQELSNQIDFISSLDTVYADFRKYMESSTWYSEQYANNSNYIAYFCLEYGINESFPNYSGGLGILAGDHLKSASDLGVPIIAVGLLYQMGYFRQHITQGGWQNESYYENDFYSMAMVLMRKPNGDPMLISVQLPNGNCYAQIWKLQVGRVTLYLLDTNVTENNTYTEYRDITDQLYGGTTETRIQQEILLGIGGIRALRELGINPTIIHINEGHAAFATLECARFIMQDYDLDFRSAGELAHAGMVFTTHTPVPAGNEVFPAALVEKYFQNYWQKLGLSREEFLRLGNADNTAILDSFSMTILALRLSSFRNGVSKLHGDVARSMWKSLWKDFPENDIPIGSITNGIHSLSWAAEGLAELYDRYLSPRWRTDTHDNHVWNRVDAIPNEELWRVHNRYRERLVLFARNYLLKKQRSMFSASDISQVHSYLNPDALTIGFARRFATYKRATLLFSDMARLKKILLDEDRPVQMIIAGKAHPHDTAGKEMIQKIIHDVRAFGLDKHVIFLEDYSIAVARRLVKGCDVWLNTPRRPHEASGTSGMKAALNGCLHASILDGWWAEAYNGENGFSIGTGEEYADTKDMDIIESATLYELLEQAIIPEFYERSNKVPVKWVSRMKSAIKTCAGVFSTHRMVRDYTQKYYVPALQRATELRSNNAEKAVALRDWKYAIRSSWNNVAVAEVYIHGSESATVGSQVHVYAKVLLGNIQPKDVVVEAYHGHINADGLIINGQASSLDLQQTLDGGYYEYRGSYICDEGGKQGCTVRITPTHPHIYDNADMRLCTWAR